MSGQSGRELLDCILPDPANTVTDRMNSLLNSSGPGYTLRLCPNARYLIQAPIRFAAPQQEISTGGYPTGDSRAMLVVDGPVANGTGHTTAIDGTCVNCTGVKIRNIQINGTRGNAPPTVGGANIEMGGPNSDQLIEHVRSFDPRSWSCLHIAEGALNCNKATVQKNDIGPCGSDVFQEWADGISMSCRNSLVRDNVIKDATDGGIVLFGSPGTVVENNTIHIENHTLLGGINMVDYEPFFGDFTGTIVRNNTVSGPFAQDPPTNGASKGTNTAHAIIKIGVAIGPRTWFGNRYGDNVSFSGQVIGNNFTGAFSYAIAISSSRNFIVQGNMLFGNTSFIGSLGPNCSVNDTLPAPSPFIFDPNTTSSTYLQPGFGAVADGDSLTCIVPPQGGDYWPFKLPNPPSGAPASLGHHLGGGKLVGLIVGIILAVLGVFVTSWFICQRARGTKK